METGLFCQQVTNETLQPALDSDAQKFDSRCKEKNALDARVRLLFGVKPLIARVSSENSHTLKQVNHTMYSMPRMRGFCALVIITTILIIYLGGVANRRDVTTGPVDKIFQLALRQHFHQT